MYFNADQESIKRFQEKKKFLFEHDRHFEDKKFKTNKKSIAINWK